MTGTDSTKQVTLPGGPAFILVKPQMGENIGAAARAMMNCSQKELRLVSPRDGWPSERATAMAVGALDMMPPVQVYDDTAAAISDCHYVYATTARPRDMVKPVFTGAGAAEDMVARHRAGQKIGILFGGERAGLDNDEIALAQAIITIPLNPAFSSLNLAQGVLLVAYEWTRLLDETPDTQTPSGDSHPASQDVFQELCERLEQELENGHFFRSPAMRPTIMRNIRNMLARARMTDQEARTFHGIISALIGKKAPPP